MCSVRVCIRIHTDTHGNRLWRKVCQSWRRQGSKESKFLPKRLFRLPFFFRAFWVFQLPNAITKIHAKKCSSSNTWIIFYVYDKQNKTDWNTDSEGLDLIWFIRHFLTERYRNWISWYLDVSPWWCRHFQYFGCLTGAPATNFARKRVKPRYLTLFRATKNCVVICSASLLYEMGYPFRSTVFVPMKF